MEAKVALVSGAREAYGLAPSLRAVGLARSTWYYHTRTRVTYAQKYAHLEAPLKAIAEAHPEYGYRRATAELRETYGHRVNRKVVERLHRLWDLPLRRVRRPKPSAIRRAIDAAGPRANLLSRRRKAEIGPLEVIYTDFTELRYADGTRKAWLIPLLDHATKYVPGFAVGETGELRAGARGMDRGGANPGPLAGLVRGRDRPPRSGSRVHRLRVDRPASLGRSAALLRPSRARRQPRDGELLRPLQGGEPIPDPRRRIARGTQRHRPGSDRILQSGAPSLLSRRPARPWLSSRTSTARAEQHNKPRGQVSNFWGSLHSDASVPFPFDVHAMIYSRNAPTLEAALHREFSNRRMNKVNHRKEFFEVEIDEIVAAIRAYPDEDTAEVTL